MTAYCGICLSSVQANGPPCNTTDMKKTMNAKLIHNHKKPRRLMYGFDALIEYYSIDFGAVVKNNGPTALD